MTARARPGAGPLWRMLVEDHERLEALLDASVADPAHFDDDKFEQFRAGLLRHIGIEEKILFPDAARRRGGVPLDAAARLRIEHAALTSLCVPTPDAAIVAEIKSILAVHDPVEEEAGGVYEAVETLAGDEVGDLIARARAAPAVPLAKHYDGPRAHRTAASALESARKMKRKT